MSAIPEDNCEDIEVAAIVALQAVRARTDVLPLDPVLAVA
jgi:hypothetical protein